MPHDALWEWSFKWRVNIIFVATNNLKHYLTEVSLLKMINGGSMTNLDKWPETLPNQSPFYLNDQWSPQGRNICYSEKQFELVTANINAFWEWSFKWRVNIIFVSTKNDLKHYLTEVRLLKMINEAPKTSSDKWPETLPNQSPTS
jgi:hypothetical protein